MNPSFRGTLIHGDISLDFEGPHAMTDTRTVMNDPAVNNLSALIFQHYHTNPKPGMRSMVSDRLAQAIANDQDVAMTFADAIARTIDSEYEGEIVGFFIQPAKPKSLLDMILEAISDPTPLHEHPIAGPLGLNPMAIWARAAILLERSGYADVTFDHEYAEVDDDNYRPGIHGEGVTPLAVNGAIMLVLEEGNAMDHIDSIASVLATHQDEDGWVFSRAGID